MEDANYIKYNKFGKSYMKATMVVTGGLGGGISSTIAGGKFVDGFKQGLITASLNHVAHSTADSFLGDNEDQGAGPKKRFPSPKEIKDKYNYPSELCNKAGNECAIRLSDSLERNGYDISVLNKYRKTHEHNGITHQPSAKALADFSSQNDVLGHPKYFNSTKDF